MGEFLIALVMGAMAVILTVFQWAWLFVSMPWVEPLASWDMVHLISALGQLGLARALAET